MKFIKLDINQTSSQKLRVFNSHDYDLDCTFELDSNKNLTKLTLEMVNIHSSNDHEIKSVIICKNTISGNSDFYFLLINMEKGDHLQSFTLKPGDSGYPSSINYEEGNLTFVDSYEYDNPSQEINNCIDIKIYNYDFHPKHKKGNIVVGNR